MSDQARAPSPSSPAPLPITTAALAAIVVEEWDGAARAGGIDPATCEVTPDPSGLLDVYGVPGGGLRRGWDSLVPVFARLADRLEARGLVVERSGPHVVRVLGRSAPASAGAASAGTMCAVQQEFFERLVPHIAPHLKKDEKYVDAAIRLIANAAASPTTTPTPPSVPVLAVFGWGRGIRAGAPLQDLHALQSEAPFRPAVFRMSSRTALTLLAHPSVWRYCRDHNCLSVMEVQEAHFRLPGVGEIQVVADVPDGEVQYVSVSNTGGTAVLARLKGAL
jgi:hypothetical protein